MIIRPPNPLIIRAAIRSKSGPGAPRTCTTEPLSAPIEVLGPVGAEFAASATAASADLFARLCDVDPGGRSVNVRRAGPDPGRRPHDTSALILPVV
jgi:X-Pro dipeptidyl-peptidase C-terminal non-catalytic domain